MARIKVPGDHTEIAIFDGAVSTTYKVKDGVIVVDDAHVASVLAGVSGSELAAPEAPAKEK